MATTNSQKALTSIKTLLREIPKTLNDFMSKVEVS
jgi:hypothetical protein